MLPEERLDLTTEPLTKLEDFERIQTEWVRLWRSCPHATPFQLPQWLIPWWKHFGRGELHGCAVRCEGELVALAPFFVSEGMLYLIGTSHSDSLDLLIAPGDEERYMNALLEFMAREWDDWCACEFHQLPLESPLLLATPSWLAGCQVCPQDPCPVLRLPANCVSLDAAIPPGICKKLRYYRRRAEAEGDFNVVQVGRDTLDECVDALFRLHSARWQERGQAGVLADENVIAFHREVIPAMLGADMLRLFALRMNGEIIAVYYGFRDSRRAYAYLGGFDPKYIFMGPGALLIGAAIEDAVCSGRVEFDFLRGQEEYKYKWGAKDRPHFILCWQRRHTMKAG